MDYFFMSQADEKAQDNPMIVMVDEGTGQKYARAVGHKGLGQEHEMDWVVKDMAAEVKAWDVFCGSCAGVEETVQLGAALVSRFLLCAIANAQAAIALHS